MIMICAFSRLTIAKLIKDQVGKTLLSTFLDSWVSHFGKPQQVLVDAAANLSSKEWLRWGEAWGVKIMCAPGSCQYQNGLVERAVRTLKCALKVITKIQPKMSFEEKLRVACFAKNNAPSTVHNHPPVTIMTGRTSLLEEYTRPIEPETSTAAEDQERIRVALAMVIKAEIVKKEADRIIRIATNRNLRAHTVNPPPPMSGI